MAYWQSKWWSPRYNVIINGRSLQWRGDGDGQDRAEGDETVGKCDVAINGWTLTWEYGNGERVTSSWNATLLQSGNNVTARNPAGHWNGNLAADGGTVSFGMQLSYNSTTAVPTNFVLNGISCNGDIVPTNTPPSSTATPLPPTATSSPPTTTSIPPTATSVSPTATPPPLTATPGNGATCAVAYIIVNFL